MRMSGPRLVEPQRELANAETISGLVEGGGLITFKGCLTHSPQPTGLNQCSLVVLKYLWTEITRHPPDIPCISGVAFRFQMPALGGFRLKKHDVFTYGHLNDSHLVQYSEISRPVLSI
ncbi:hypothetical protein CIHG_02173 [Coccidioides immitis H538.4]|uniref:Uncharacterized protein n=1 Tax=Coccidioides immitis H538.4 TaxID=396776 RepID=A0A0J8UBA8_COCIT|nr:hypothetical protein CIHG_02173 [Coccidioides immitis H538.4]